MKTFRRAIRNWCFSFPLWFGISLAMQAVFGVPRGGVWQLATVAASGALGWAYTMAVAERMAEEKRESIRLSPRDEAGSPEEVDDSTRIPG